MRAARGICLHQAPFQGGPTSVAFAHLQAHSRIIPGTEADSDKLLQRRGARLEQEDLPRVHAELCHDLVHRAGEDRGGASVCQ